MGVKCPSPHMLGLHFQFGLNLPSWQHWLQLEMHWGHGTLQGRSLEAFSLSAAPWLGGEPLLHLSLHPAFAFRTAHLHPLQHQEGQAGGLMPSARDTQGSAVTHRQDELVHTCGLNSPGKSLPERERYFSAHPNPPRKQGRVAVVL